MARSRLWPRLLLVALSSLLGLVLVEVGLRLAFPAVDSERELRQRLEASRRAGLGEGGHRFGLRGLVQASTHPDVVYELKPRLDGSFRGQSLRTNGLGLRRDTEIEVAKPAGTFRVVGLGDSSMFGWGVAQDETYLARLERLLNEASPGNPRFEVLNCAAPGYNTVVEVAVLEHRCGRFDPDLVIVHFYDNDLELPHFLQPLRATEDGGWSLYSVWLVRALFAGEGTERRAPELLRGGGQDEGQSQELRASRERYRSMKGADGFIRAFERLAGLARERRIPVVVLMLGTAGERSKLAVAEAQRHGFELVDAAPHFGAALAASGAAPAPRAWKQAYMLPDDGHPTPLAHQRFAEVLLPVVRRYR